MRSILLSLEAEVRKRLDLSLPLARWLVRRAAFVNPNLGFGPLFDQRAGGCRVVKVNVRQQDRPWRLATERNGQRIESELRGRI